MFCLFFIKNAKDDDLIINVIHCGKEYKFSRNLCLEKSSKLAFLVQEQGHGEPISIEYDYEYDDFQLISNLFNYKHLFINKNNIKFLEFAANYLQIPSLKKKVNKYIHQYEDIILNPIFSEILSLKHQIFSISKQKHNSKDQEFNYKINKTINSSNNFNIKDDNNNINFNMICTNEKTTNVNSENHENLYKIHYRPEFSSTVAHLIFSACFARPTKINFYLNVIKNDPLLLNDFVTLLKSNNLSSKFCTTLRNILENRDDKSMFLFVNYLDTSLPLYLQEVGSDFCNLFKSTKSIEVYIKTIENDDIDAFQSLLTSHPNILKCKETFSVLFSLCAAFPSIKCFKYMFLNNSSLIVEYRKYIRYSIIGGNLEIFHLLLHRYESSPADFIKDTILFHRNKMLKWIITNHIQFLSLYNTCCSRVIYGKKPIRQKFYRCQICHQKVGCGCCKFCAKNCHKNEEDHTVTYDHVSFNCFCDDVCQISENIEKVDNTVVNKKW